MTKATRNKTVDLKCRPQRQIQRADSNSLQRIRERLVALGAKALAPHNHCNSREQSDGHPSGGTNPVVVESKLQEVRDPNQQSRNADAVQPVGADA
jgi:hypothetical protein